MVGIIVAMTEELEAIKEYMNNTTVEIKCENEFYIGIIGKKEVILTTCGVGKVNSARIAQILIDNYNPDFIINIGVAGSVNNNLRIGDIVIGEKLVQYDFDLTAFGREKGEISDKVGKFIYSDKELINKAENQFWRNNEIKVVKGTIASGDRFVTETSLSKEIKDEFEADCVEMEGAAIAQVCFLDRVPFIVIRSISDSPNENNKVDFETFLHKATQNVASFINRFLGI